MQTVNLDQTLSKFNKLAIEAAKSLGLTVIDIRLAGQSGRKSLEICIYKPDADISFADCQAMSHSFEQALEAEEARGADLLKGPYMIEVVSPGIERRLTTAGEYALFTGKPVRICAKEKIGALGTEFTGLLCGANEHSIIVSQAQPLALNQSKKTNSAQTKLPAVSNSELSIAFSQIYAVYLWPGSKSSGKQ